MAPTPYTKVSSYINPEDVLAEMGFEQSKRYPLAANATAAQKNVNVGANFVDHFPVGAQVLISTWDADTTTTPGANRLTLEYGQVASISTPNVVLVSNLGQAYNTSAFATLQMLSKYTEATYPRYRDLDLLVQQIQDKVDSLTHTSWAQKVVSGEMHNFHPDSMMYGSLYGIYPRRYTIRDTDQLIQLNHSDVKQLSGTDDTAYTGYAGDSMMTWDGTSWIERVNSDNPYGADSYSAWTYGRDEDYWMVPEQGLVLFANDRPSYNYRAVRFVYRYGQTIRAAAGAAGFGDIQLAVKAFAKAAILRDRRFNVDFPGGRGADALSLQQAISSYETEGFRLCQRHVKMFWNTDRH